MYCTMPLAYYMDISISPMMGLLSTMIMTHLLHATKGMMIFHMMHIHTRWGAHMRLKTHEAKKL